MGRIQSYQHDKEHIYVLRSRFLMLPISMAVMPVPFLLNLLPASNQAVDLVKYYVCEVPYEGNIICHKQSCQLVIK